MRLASCLLAITLWLAAASTGLARPGDLDTTFGSGGKAVVDLGGGELGSSLALQSDGRILIGGATGQGGKQEGIVARLRSPEGTLDPSYAAGKGWSIFDFGAGFGNVNGVALQSTGGIVVTGTHFLLTGATVPFVSRVLNPGGGLDPSFGTGGTTTPTLLPGEDFRALVLQPDDRLVVAGSGTFDDPGQDMTVARFTAGGVLDQSYAGGSGWSRLNFLINPGAEKFDSAKAVALAPDQRIVVAGANANNTDTVKSFAVARLLNPQGTFDPSFGPTSNGTATVSFAGPAEARAVAVQPDGGIVLAGNVDGLSPGVALARLLPSGFLDPSFGDGGRSVPFKGNKDRANAMVLQPDGKIVVAGTTGASADTDIFVLRLQPNGQPDSTFGLGGRVVVNIGGKDEGNAVALQPDGRIVVAGDTLANGGQDLAAVRLEGDPPAGPGGAGGAGGGGGSSSAASRCAGKAATIIGSAGPDKLKGTARADVIVGLGGGDKINGLGGNDIICGGAGADRITGGAGRDALRGDAGPDILIGGAGADLLTGGVGTDRLLGGAGADRLLGGAGADRLLGGAGADRLLGGAGKDILKGGVGKNVQTQ